MRTLLFVTIALFAAGCSPVENKANHIFHAGESATLVTPGQIMGYAAATKADSDSLAHAVNTKNVDEIKKMVAAGRAIEVEPDTAVRIKSDSYNEREVEITAGHAKGKTGWVPFEWLKRQS